MKKSSSQTTNYPPRLALGETGSLQTTHYKLGFTLVEVLVALSVFIVAVVVIIQLFPVGLKSSRASKNETTAINLAQAGLESAKGTAYDYVISEFRTRVSLDPTSPFYNFEREPIVQFVDTNLDTSEVDLGLKKITVTVFWQESGQEQEVSATYIKSR
ncbi:unnamed protein product [marine sediment metagenome]|uniref:Prepilin-type N-terminal cleavage/methylation domain-containing protein n=1 Tax=marine sediment metagenome TaxID=412755 RepID=X1C903_9ZZZZ